MLDGVDAARRPRPSRSRRRRPRAGRGRRRAAHQPPFDASAMDGYAVRAADVATRAGDAARDRRGRAPAHRFAGAVGAGRGGAHLHRRAACRDGADAVVIQEDTDARRRAIASSASAAPRRGNIRPRGVDFRRARCCSRAGPAARARARSSLAAAMGHGELPVRRAPARRDPLDRRRAGAARRQARARPDHLLQRLRRSPRWSRRRAASRDLGIARDTRESLDATLAQAARRRHHRHHRRRLGRRPRSGRRRR